MSSSFDLVGQVTVGYCTGDALGRCQMKSRLPRVPGVGHVHNDRNASTAMIPTNMRRI